MMLTFTAHQETIVEHSEHDKRSSQNSFLSSFSSASGSQCPDKVIQKLKNTPLLLMWFL